MSNAVFFNSYKLREGASVPEFLLTVDRLINENISKQKGFISSKVMVEGDTWADYAIFETMEDAQNFVQASGSNPSRLAQEFYSFLDFSTCKSHFFTVEKSYN